MADLYADFQQYKLDNGIPVYQLEMPGRPVQHVAFILGSGNYHSRDIPGLAHFAEHIVANSAGCVQLRKDLSEEGGYLLGGGGQTGWYATTYGFGLPYLHTQFDDLMAKHRDYLFKNSLSHSIEAEKGPFAAEFQESFGRKRKMAGNWLTYHATRKGHWDTPTIAFGDENGISPFTKAQVENFYRQHYVPANLRILTVGPMKKEEFLASLKKNGWESLSFQGTAGEAPPKIYPIHIPTLAPFANIDDEETSSALFHEAFYSQDLPAGVLNVAADIISEYLNDELRQKHKLVYGCRVSHNRAPEYRNIIVSCSGVAPKNTEVFWKAYLEALKNIIEGDVISTKSVERMKKINTIAILINDPTARDAFNGSRRSLARGLPIRTDAQLTQELKEVTLDAVKNIAAGLAFKSSFCSLDLASASQAPAGLPLYDLFEANTALKRGEMPKVLGADKVT